ncbi:MAG: hypothetical protein HRU08_04075 [Oleispira sp.]|nr:hypothetical protein [Oleispira sp.]
MLVKFASKIIPSLTSTLLILLQAMSLSCYADAIISIDDSDTKFEDDEDFYYDDASTDLEYTGIRAFFTVEALLGGQTLEHIEFENGETDSIRAGSGVHLALGVAHLLFNKQIDVGIRGGYLFDLVTAKNDQGKESVLSFTRKPIDIFSHYWINRHRWGGGISMHFDPIFTSRETTDSARYHHAYGAYAEYLYHFTGTGSALGIKFLSINYKNKETGKISDGSAWGITFNQLF